MWRRFRLLPAGSLGQYGVVIHSLAPGRYRTTCALCCDRRCLGRIKRLKWHRVRPFISQFQWVNLISTWASHRRKYLLRSIKYIYMNTIRQ